MKKTNTYPATIKQTFHEIIHCPTGWLSISLFTLLLSLPVITWGIGYTFALVLADREMDGRNREGFKRCRVFLKTRQARWSFLMGLLDLLVVVALFFSIKTIIDPETTILSRLASCIFFWIDLFFLVSGIYRYPILAYQNPYNLSTVFVQGITITFSDIGNVILILMVSCLFLILSIVTGLFLFLFFPGSVALLICCNFHEKQKAMDNDKRE